MKEQEKLLNKIADFLDVDVSQVRSATDLYTEEEKLLEGQSVIHYYEWRRELRKLKDESPGAFEKRLQEWKFKICNGCHSIFAYSYCFDDISYCSLTCLDTGLRKIGLRVHYGRPLVSRWGYAYPAIVPAPALESIEVLLKQEGFEVT